MPFKRYTVQYYLYDAERKHGTELLIKHVIDVCLSAKSLTGHKTEYQNVILWRCKVNSKILLKVNSNSILFLKNYISGFASHLKGCCYTS